MIAQCFGTYTSTGVDAVDARDFLVVQVCARLRVVRKAILHLLSFLFCPLRCLVVRFCFLSSLADAYLYSDLGCYQ